MLQICCICKEEEAKYKCPACGRRTCSVKCSRNHKEQFSCSGNLDVTEYVDRSSLLSTPHQLNRDYRFLQDINRRLELSERYAGPLATRGTRGRGRGRQNRQHTGPTTINGVKVHHLPTGMERARLNKSGWNNKLKKFFWTVEWTEDIATGPSTENKYHRKEVDANTPLKDIFQAPEHINIYFRVVNCPVNKQRVVLMDRDQPLNDLLQSHSVIEFPTFVLSTDTPEGCKLVGSTDEEDSEEDTSDDSSDDSSDSSSDSSDSSDSEGADDSEADADNAVNPDRPQDTSSHSNNASTKPLQEHHITNVSAFDDDDTPEEASSKMSGTG